MARYKGNVSKIQTLDEANLALKEIGLLEHELEIIDGEANKKIAQIKEECAKKGEESRKRITEICAMLGAYAEYNRAELFKDSKSQKLSFGEFGFRKSTSIHIKKTTIDLLKKLKFLSCIRIKEEPDKEKMSEMSDEELLQVDAVRKLKDAFFCEANREEVNKELLNKSM